MLAWTMLLSAFLSPALAADNLCLVRDGKPVAQIVTGQGASNQAQGAALELQTYLKRITGAELPVVETSTTGQAAILVGQAAAKAAAEQLGLPLPTGLTPTFDDEGYVVATRGDALILAGNETEPYQGTWYAVSDFLETLGCRWYFPGDFGEVVPNVATLSVPELRKTVKPDLRVRDTWYSGHLAASGQQQQEFAQWKRRNRMSQTTLWMHCADPAAKYLQNPVDDSTYRLLPKEKYFAEHPEFYAMNPGGTRNDRFLCMSNPGALQAATDTVMEYFRANPDHHTFAFSPPDAPVLCNCPDCVRAMHGGYKGEGNGDVSDAYFGFVFRLADEVAKRDPTKWITTMAYYNRCRPPEGIEGKRKNLLIQLASIQQCTVHSYADKDCPSRQEYAAMLKRWGELSAGQVFYEYAPHDWSHSQRPHWRSQGIAEDLRLLKSVGGWGFSNEGQMAWLSTGFDYFVRMQLAWDLKQDPEVMLRDACTRFFGPAAEPMWTYYAAIEKAIRTCPSHLFAFSEDARDAGTVLFPAALRTECRELLTRAARLAKDEPYAGHVRAFRLHFDRLDAFAKAYEAMARGDYAAAAKLGERMTETVKELNDSALLQDAGPWGGACSGAGVTAAARKVIPWTDGTQARLVTVLPEDALFRTDPASQGVVHRWYLPGDTHDWRHIRMTTGWQHQGVLTAEGRPYHGVAWYRVTVKWEGSPNDVTGLYVPDLRGGANLWVWANGTLAGYTPSGGEHLTVDLTGKLKPGSNELVFRVDDGGLALPPFLFSPGPEHLTEVPVLPNEWLFRTDPQDVGRNEGWAKADASDDGWRAIPININWEQTWVGAYDGVAWYRTHFKAPAELAGKKAVLSFGGVDEEAWVYVNGELVGEHSTASTGKTVDDIWDKPFDVPVPNLKPGEDNVLAVRVNDTTLAGGIFKPVKLYVAKDAK